MALLAVIFFFSGLEMAFWAGEFPQLLSSDVIGLVLAFVGVGEVVGGLFFGPLSDRAGRAPALLLGWSGAVPESGSGVPNPPAVYRPRPRKAAPCTWWGLDSAAGSSRRACPARTPCWVKRA